MTVTVYTKPGCSNCVRVKDYFDNHGVQYEEQPINDEILDEAVSAGIRQAPIVTAGDLMFGGYNETQLRNIKENK